jgi:hypothetical protein
LASPKIVTSFQRVCSIFAAVVLAGVVRGDRNSKRAADFLDRSDAADDGAHDRFPCLRPFGASGSSGAFPSVRLKPATKRGDAQA